MNWYHSVSAVDRLASAYVLGTLNGRARRRFEAVMRRQPPLLRAVESWTQRLGPLYTALPVQTPSAALWGRIAQATGTAPVVAKGQSWWQRWLAPVPAGALAMGLVVGAVVPALWQAEMARQADTELPASYVGVLATALGQPGLVISSLRHGKVVDIKQVTPVPVPPGQVLYLWRIDKAGAVTGLGPLPNGKWTHMTLSEPAEKTFFSAVELAVSLEPAGTQPNTPSQAFVYRGLCGKLWH